MEGAFGYESAYGNSVRIIVGVNYYIRRGIDTKEIF